MPAITLTVICCSRPPPPPLPPSLPLSHSMLNNVDIVTLKSRADLDFFSLYNRYYRDLAINDDPYFGLNISSNYNDDASLSAACQHHKSSVFLSINIQSLMSKHEQLVLEIAEFEQKNITVDVIALQETWDIKYPELVVLDGFNPIIFKRRRGMRGGGGRILCKKWNQC
jgi:hypothetical protein